MSLNTIELGDLIVTELYPNSLLATEAASPAAARTSVTKIPLSPGLPSGSPPAATTQTAPAGPNQPVGSSAAPDQGTAPVTRTSPLSGSGGGYKILGNNRRQITVLVQSPGVAFLADDQLSFLTRMLEACKMNVGDVAIVNLASAAVQITALKQQLQPKIVLLFGMEPVAIKLPMTFPWFKIHTYDECTFLCAPSLEQLVLPGEESKLLKSKLWMCLKTLFGI